MIHEIINLGRGELLFMADFDFRRLINELTGNETHLMLVSLPDVHIIYTYANISKPRHLPGFSPIYLDAMRCGPVSLVA